ncbi:MAG: DEAD/DEAH box helicase [Candidatus Methanodesulfokora sp.]
MSLSVVLIIALSIIALSILLLLLYYKRIINDGLERAIKNKDSDGVFAVLSSSKLKISFIDKHLILMGLEFLFFRGEFDRFLVLAKRLKIADDRIYFLQESDVLGLDIETEVEYDKKPREIGLIALRSGDWKELTKLYIDRPESMFEMYGSTPQAFLSRLIRRFRVIVGHNIYLFDADILRSWGVDLEGVKFIDTYALALVSLPEAISHSLEHLSVVLGVDYIPHRADEDAHASLVILPKLISIAKRKGVLADIKSASFEPLSGLQEVEVPEITADFLPIKTRGSKPGEVVVTMDASGFSDAWYPKRIDISLIEKCEKSASSQRLALAIVKSFVASGGDPERLKALNIPYEGLKEALTSIMNRITEDNPVEDQSEGFVVEYRYLKDLFGRLRERTGLKIVFRGAYLLRAYYQDYMDLLKFASHAFSRVELETPFEMGISGVEYRRPEITATFQLVKGGLDKSSRHSNLLAGLLAAVAQKGRSLVLVSNGAEEFISEEVSRYIRAKIEVHRLDRDEIIRTLEKVSRFSSMGYNIVLYSIKTFGHKRGFGEVEVALKSLSEVLRLSGKICKIINTDKELLSQLDLKSFAEEVEIEPLELPMEISYSVFPSLDEVLADLENIVRDVWGFSLRAYQRRLVARLLAPYTRAGRLLNNPFSIVLLPTGSGKSLIFQSVALLLKRRIGGTTVVISPLLALIEDHLNSLLSRGVKAVAITSMAYDRLNEYIRGLARGRYDIVYMTPEQLEKEEIRRSLEKADINYFVIDEIHTLYKWGRTFRPSYEYLAQYIRRSRKDGLWLPLAGFTATLPSKGLEEVIRALTGDEKFSFEEIDLKSDFNRSKLDLEQVKVFKGPVIRENIVIDVVKAPSDQERLNSLLNVVKELIKWAESFSSGSPWLGIVYTGFVRSSREHENASSIAKFLSENLGEKVIYFHGQMSDSDKKQALSKIYAASRGKIKEPRIVVATKAFGLGVDIPNVRWVVHYMMPESIEDYYQEIGRGGRDGRACRAVMLYSPKYDYKRRLMLIKRTLLKPSLVAEIYSTIARAEEGAAVPMALLVPALAGKYRLNKLIDFLRSQGRLPEVAENAIERALNALSNLNILSYDIIRDEFILVDRRAPLKKPVYPINEMMGLIGSRALVDIPTGKSPQSGEKHLYLDERGELIIKDHGRPRWISITGIPTKAIRVNSIRRVPLGEVASSISDYQFHALFSLYLMNEFSSLLLNTPEKERDFVARGKITEYLSSSIEELYRSIVSKMRDLVVKEHLSIIKYYRELMKSKYLYYRTRFIDKHKLCDLISSLALLYIVESGIPPVKIALIVPYGYRKVVLEMLRTKMKRYGLLLMDPIVTSIKRRDVSSLRKEDMERRLAGTEVVFLLVTHPTLRRVEYLLNADAFRIYVKRVY